MKEKRRGENKKERGIIRNAKRRAAVEVRRSTAPKSIVYMGGLPIDDSRAPRFRRAGGWKGPSGVSFAFLVDSAHTTEAQRPRTRRLISLVYLSPCMSLFILARLRPRSSFYQCLSSRCSSWPIPDLDMSVCRVLDQAVGYIKQDASSYSHPISYPRSLHHHIPLIIRPYLAPLYRADNLPSDLGTDRRVRPYPDHIKQCVLLVRRQVGAISTDQRLIFRTRIKLTAAQTQADSGATIQAACRPLIYSLASWRAG